jgi:hypothetical protein
MNTENEQLSWLVNRTEIIETVVRFANAFDKRAWDALRSCLTDCIDTDYSQFRGQAPSQVTADEYIASRRQSLAGLRTLHISTNHEVRIDGSSAVCWSAYRIYRLDPSREPGQNRLDTAGNYEHGLIRTADGWRISSIRQTVTVQQGNTQVHGAFQPMGSGPESAS